MTAAGDGSGADVTPFRLLIRMVVAPADQAEFEKVWLEMAATAERHPANVAQWLAKDRNDPEVYYIASDWTDHAAYREFIAGPGHAEHAARLKELRREQTLTSMSLLHHLVGPASRRPEPGGADPGKESAP
nr:monooxygenase [Actinoallomurus sp.]